MIFILHSHRRIVQYKTAYYSFYLPVRVIALYILLSHLDVSISIC
jgi:hypothetical protein